MFFWFQFKNHRKQWKTHRFGLSTGFWCKIHLTFKQLNTKVSRLHGFWGIWFPPIFPKIGGSNPSQNGVLQIHLLNFGISRWRKTYKFSPHPSVLGGLQVQDPGGSPGHCTQDHEDPNLEADAEEGVGLPEIWCIWDDLDLKIWSKSRKPQKAPEKKDVYHLHVVFLFISMHVNVWWFLVNDDEVCWSYD